ncbi:hypothetical protein EUX98_g1279 [Antrodiella citrinella]|uniref:Uncharacterized protein n=1 Tax=Antrodiella citrinella TaxID=2447956 RepID=A0A4S4N1U1_9APHY|nr:hypothetical protein EUX98_g1279 [Antrodiella citrinella]
MEYVPRYPQPFTVGQAVMLDVPTITEEISRIGNSLEHLRRTQSELLEALAEDPDDPDFRKAYEENEDVIGSQAERVSMLQLALTEKGIPTSSHYDIAAVPPAAPPTASRTPASPPQEEVTGPETPAATNGIPAVELDEDGGIDL